MTRILTALVAFCVVVGLFAAVTTASAFHRDLHFYRVQPAFPKAKGGVITLDYMPGGIIGDHMRYAKVWRDRGYRLVIRDDQYSAAAIMVLGFKKAGGKVCARRGADLYFHAPNVEPVHEIISAKAAGLIAGAPERGWKRVSPAAFGIPVCAGA